MSAETLPVVLALGANLGDRAATLQSAIVALQATGELTVQAVSPVVETDPVGGPEQPDYLNLVLLARTTLAPLELLALAHQVEADHGRERAVRWGARTLDIDLIAYGQVQCHTDRLTLPHPRAQLRGFVLAPWLALDPAARLPTEHGSASIGELLARLENQGGVRARPDVVVRARP